jgi:hypothetical protein
MLNGFLHVAELPLTIAEPAVHARFTAALDARSRRGDKAGDENAFRHYRHLHYRLAQSAGPAVFAFLPEHEKRPGQQARGNSCPTVPVD